MVTYSHTWGLEWELAKLGSKSLGSDYETWVLLFTLAELISLFSNCAYPLIHWNSIFSENLKHDGFHWFKSQSTVFQSHRVSSMALWHRLSISECLVALVTNCHKQHDSEQHVWAVFRFWRSEVLRDLNGMPSKDWQGCLPAGVWREMSLFLFCWFQRPPAFLVFWLQHSVKDEGSVRVTLIRMGHFAKLDWDHLWAVGYHSVKKRTIYNADPDRTIERKGVQSYIDYI